MLPSTKSLASAESETAQPLPTDFSSHYSYIVNQLVGTLHKAELEFAAALIIKWHRLRGCESWIAFSREDVATLFKPD